VFGHRTYSPDLALADYFFFPKVKSHLKGCFIFSISDIQKAVKYTPKTIAKDVFYKGKQKMYESKTQCGQLEGMYFEN
jgi:hypothetical protein